MNPWWGVGVSIIHLQHHLSPVNIDLLAVGVFNGGIIALNPDILNELGRKTAFAHATCWEIPELVSLNVVDGGGSTVIDDKTNLRTSTEHNDVVFSPIERHVRHQIFPMSPCCIHAFLNLLGLQTHAHASSPCHSRQRSSRHPTR